MTRVESLGIPDDLSIDKLQLDPLNPRLPEAYRGRTQGQLLEYIAETYNAIEIARSIALHGYFHSEPLIVISETEDSYTVVEGNRRLVGLQILADPKLANNLDDNDEWRKLASAADVEERIPVVIAPDRRAVAPIIGYRHISGIEPWDPYAQARFIASLVDNEHLEFQDVADLVGERSSDVAAKYRNFATVTQAKDEFEINVARVIDRFGVFNEGHDVPSPPDIYIGAPAPADVDMTTPPLPSDSESNVGELFSWVFGDDTDDAVIQESRDITDLGQVVASVDGLEILKETRDLHSAFIAAGGLRERLLRRLSTARNNLDDAHDDFATYHNDDEVQELLLECQDSLQRFGGTRCRALSPRFPLQHPQMLVAWQTGRKP